MTVNLMNGKKGVSHQALANYLRVDAAFLAKTKSVPLFQVWDAQQVKDKFPRKAAQIIRYFGLN